MKRIFILLIFLLLTNVQARLLDKMLAVVDGEIITLSQVQRINSNIFARRNISPIIFTKTKYSIKQITQLLVERILIRNKLSEIGYIITDDQVESQIKETEKNLGVNRKYLLNFLNSNNLTFDEYFQLIKMTLEFNIFHGRIIRPLVSISEQEVKNRFYQENINNKTFAFRYSLVDFSLSADKIPSKSISKFKRVLKNFQIDGILPNEFKDVQTNEIDNITEDGLSSNLQLILKQTNEGDFSKPIKIDNHWHSFFVKKKDLSESEVFSKQKDIIKNKIFHDLSKKMIDIWYERTKNKHYVKFFL